MKSVLTGGILAVVLFVAAAASWGEARMARGISEAHRRLATLHYDADDNLDQVSTIWNRVPWPGGASGGDVQRQRATVSYWRAQYQSLNDLTQVTGAQALTDPAMLFVAANASFRASMPEMGDRKGAVSRLDTVVQAYADVLRRDPNATDAAYNYEYVSRLRDEFAKAPARPTAKDLKAQREMAIKAAADAGSVSVDLPAGPTIHGRPGGPPEGTDMSDFKTISPMRYDEREEQMDPGRGKEFRRKG